jgi:hypothetical protein
MAQPFVTAIGAEVEEMLALGCPPQAAFQALMSSRIALAVMHLGRHDAAAWLASAAAEIGNMEGRATDGVQRNRLPPRQSRDRHGGIQRRP